MIKSLSSAAAVGALTIVSGVFVKLRRKKYLSEKMTDVAQCRPEGFSGVSLGMVQAVSSISPEFGEIFWKAYTNHGVVGIFPDPIRGEGWWRLYEGYTNLSFRFREGRLINVASGPHVWRFNKHTWASLVELNPAYAT